MQQNICHKTYTSIYVNYIFTLFTAKENLSLSRLSTMMMKLQDIFDSGLIDPDTAPSGVLCSTPAMEDFCISVNGIVKLLQNLKPGKVAGSVRLKPLLLKELGEEIAPIIQIIFQRWIYR